MKKFNWGTGILLAFIAFIGFILFFVISMSVNKKFNYDMVTEGYYQQELDYQNQIDAMENSLDLEESVKVNKSALGLMISFPNNIDLKKITGKVSLYRPSNKQLDFEMPISISDNYLLVPENRLVDGRWDITILWKYEDKNYLHKQELNF